MNDRIVFLSHHDGERIPFGPLDKIVVTLNDDSKVDFYLEELVIENPSAKGYELHYSNGKIKMLSGNLYDPVETY